MNPSIRMTWAGVSCAVLWTLAVLSAEAQAPFYNDAPPAQKQNPKDLEVDDAIDLTHVQPSNTVDDANAKFAARAAAAIFYAAHHDAFLDVPRPDALNSDLPCNAAPVRPVNPQAGRCNEMNFGLAILAKMAYQNYFDDDQDDKFRTTVYELLRKEQPGAIGTSVDDDQKHLGFGPDRSHGEYDVLLQAYLALYYKYYKSLPPDVREILLHRLLSVNGPFPFDKSGKYPYYHVSSKEVTVDVPETENHFLMIETARYLTNQLLYESGDGTGQTHQIQFDNNRNGDGGDKPPLVDKILGKLQDILRSDLVEYNARPYQNYKMLPLLNLASYAYDDRVRLAARMALDYISAKVAVSSIDLRRSTPYRRRNTPDFYGTVDSDVRHLDGTVDPGDGHLGGIGATIGVGSQDPQTAFYAQLAGNTGILGTRPEGGYSYAMVHAGVRDYRVPPSILHLFVNHRRFYQHFHHSAPTAGLNTGQFADELYAGSPSYLISAGGHPTFYSAVVHVEIAGAAILLGEEPDLGVALPTTLIPADAADWIRRISLSAVIQFGRFGTDRTVTNNMCVAPDFACGEFTYVPPGYTNSSEYQPEITPMAEVLIGKPPHWTFIDHSTHIHVAGDSPLIGGYYLAIYRFADDPKDPSKGFVEVYDTGLHPGITFHDFVFGGHGLTGVFTKYGAAPLFKAPIGSIYTYETQSGQRILFSISGSSSEILSTSEVPGSESSDAWKHKFASGTILDSEQGSDLIKISNGDRGTITLDMRPRATAEDPLFGMHHPCRTSESGAVECAGSNQEVWVDFNSPANLPEEGDVYRPFRTLAKARDAVAAGGTINMIPGAKNEPIVLTKKMTLKSFPGSATIGRQ